VVTFEQHGSVRWKSTTGAGFNKLTRLI